MRAESRMIAAPQMALQAAAAVARDAGITPYVLGDAIEWQARDGWGPLCAALGAPIPSEPFPRVNTKEEFLARRGYCCASGCRHCPFIVD